MPDSLQETITRQIAFMRKSGRDNQHCEVKSAQEGTPKSLAETLSAFSNGQGGTVILGLSEEKGFRPVPKFNADAVYSDMLHYGDKLTPVVRPQVHLLDFEGTKIVVAIIAPMPLLERPCYVTTQGVYGGSYIRTGDGDRKLTEYEISRMLEERIQPKHDIRVVQEASLADLDLNALKLFISRQRFLTPRGFANSSDEEILVQMRVLQKADGELKPTLAGLLAFGEFPQKYFPRLCVTCTCYATTREQTSLEIGDFIENRYLDTKRLVGSIPDMVVDAVTFVRKNMHIGAHVKGAVRYDIPDYPLIAIREAVANALQHRDYSAQGCSSQVQLNLYSDCLEVLNPGGLYGALDVDELLSSGLSATRNEFLSQILEATAMPDNSYVVENRGTGLRAIRQAFVQAQHGSVRFEGNNAYFRIVFDRLSRESVTSDRKTENVREVILDLFSRQSSLSIRELQKATGRSSPTLRKYIGNLIQEGLIRTTEAKNSPKQRYRLTSNTRLH